MKSKLLIKHIAGVLAAIMLVALTGCGVEKNVESGEKQTQVTTTANEVKKTTEIEFMNWMEQSELTGWNNGLEAFKKVYPDIDLKVNSIPISAGYVDKLKVRIMTNDAPDVFQCPTEVYARVLMKNGLIQELDDFAKGDKEIDLNDYPDATLAPFKVGGKLYALPKDMSMIGMVYNKKLFSDANIEAPTDDWTWDNVRDAAKKIAKDTNGDKVNDIFGFALFKMTPLWIDPLLMLSNGAPGAVNYQKGDKVTVDDPKNIEVFNYFREIFLNDKSAPSISMQLNPVELFNSGKLGMLIGATHMLPSIKGENVDFGLALTPKGKSGNRTLPLLLAGYGIGKNSKNQNEAWQVVKYFSYGEGNHIVCGAAGTIPPTAPKRYMDIFEQGNLKKYNVANLLKQTDSMTFSQNYGENDQEIVKIYQTMLDTVFTSEKEDIAKFINDKIKPDMDKKIVPFVE